MSDKKLPYALHASVHILEKGLKIYINPSDLVEAYGLTDEDDYVYFDPRKHRKDDFLHLRITQEQLEKMHPDLIGEFALI